MMCKNITYCPFWRLCLHGCSCKRKLTDKVFDEAMQRGLSISQYMEEPECFIDIGVKYGYGENKDEKG